MTCSSCGAYVTPSVRFCSNCGAATDSEATRIARLQSRALEMNGGQDLEHTIFTVRPTMIFIKTGYALAVIAGIARRRNKASTAVWPGKSSDDCDEKR